MLIAVDAVSGHYKVPGPTAAGSKGKVATFPIAPPSTIRGFLRMLCGDRNLDPEFRYGYRAPPEGRGEILRRALVWSSAAPKDGTVGRPLVYDTFFGLKYWIQVGDREKDLVKKAIYEGVERPVFYPMYLGESTDLVSCVREISESEKDEGGGIEVVPGGRTLLTHEAGRGFSSVSAVYKGYTLKPLAYVNL